MDSLCKGPRWKEFGDGVVDFACPSPSHPCAGSVPPGPSERWTMTVSVQWPNL